jgi:glycosyltransferase involved in cell wall biosynthesis
MEKIPSLSVFFPAYNEEANLETTVEKAIPILMRIADKYEILIINDGSKDKTAEIADSLVRKYPFIRVIHHAQNRGYGGAFKSGLYNSKYDWIAFTDADGQFDFSEITKFIEKQKQTKADLVIGYYLKRAVPLIRILGSKIWEWTVFLLFGMKVTDTDCGFKLFSKKVTDTVRDLEAERGPFINSEFLIKARKAGFKIVEIGVHHYPRKAGRATGASLKVIAAALIDLFRLRKKI